MWNPAHHFMKDPPLSQDWSCDDRLHPLPRVSAPMPLGLRRALLSPPPLPSGPPLTATLHPRSRAAVAPPFCRHPFSLGHREEEWVLWVGPRLVAR
jgi:hypothetical protein